ncbi:MAG: glycosyltransferase [Oculatellaceae cyanobacterium Prado106]|jgi:glycosyltransferase involved in cell wall biosynthesis|nr:glycosyltransferase [Oculatellaceae cyanobacterium Prado106]
MLNGVKAPSQNPLDNVPLLPKQPEDRTIASNILLFDLSIQGHHPTYIRYLIQDWRLHATSQSLYIVVSPQFLEHHVDVVDLAAADESIHFVAIASESAAQLKPRNSAWNRMIRAFQEWQLLCHYAQKLKASHGLVLYFDTCQIPFVYGQKPPCPISGIYFKPSFHYPQFTLERVSKSSSTVVPARLTWQERGQHWREKLLLKQVLQRSQLHTLFSLDPFVRSFMNSIYTRNSQIATGKMVDLADPVQITAGSEADIHSLRQRLAIAPGRQVFLLFGALNGRKGVYQLLDAIALLPPHLSEKICLLLVGQANPQNQVKIQNQIEKLRQSSAVQIITHPVYIPESEVPLYFQLTDIVLAPYPKHVGMSGILIWAAAAQKPVLSSSYGLMGELVRRYRLGLTVNAMEPEAIAQGLVQFLQADDEIGDRHLMQIFAIQNSVAQFTQTIFQRILSPESPL